MITLLIVLLCGTLCCSTTNSNQNNIEMLMDHVLVLTVPNGVGTRVNVPLTCGEAYQNQSVFWKKDGLELSPALQGNQVKVLVVEMDGGNYTCHLRSNGEYLNHTLILIQLERGSRSVILEKKSPRGYIHCSADNYNGSFHCSWTRTSIRSTARVLLVKATRHQDQIPNELNANGSGVSCQDANCPYGEEQHRITLTLYIHSYSRLEAYTVDFYLRDIVRPAKLPNLTTSDGRVFSWSYPDSWERPCTFFVLQFQVKVVQSGHTCDSKEHIMLNTTSETRFEVDVPDEDYVFCVQAQDIFTNGPFGPWSHCSVNEHMECQSASLE